ncbi:MAG: 23S rRNA (adenine(2503)-C(2))-methyltransferase RlmN [Chlorobium sp.]|nr:MAG: 23S rRNA (adenine(2503)-C(2))-methyltransferase RlmN [Chlorobium sp.]
MTTPLPNIIDLSLKELQQVMIAKGEPAFRAAQIHQWLFSHQAQNFEEMTILSLGLRKKLAERFAITRPEVIEHHTSIDEACDYPTEKILLKLSDDKMIESVLIPSTERMTACLSSQVGCPFQCSFCATGKMGLQRNLSAGEIAGQVYALNNLITSKGAGQSITNLVFMGMGEPLLNTDNVIEAIETLCARNYRFTLSQKRVTISTVGVIPEIQRIGKSGMKTKLAVSLHAADQQKRESLMPMAARQYPLQELGKTLSDYCATTGMPVTIVYMLLKGVNDSLVDAKLLARFSRSFLCKINLIDYNSIINMSFGQVSNAARDIFREYLVNAGLHVTIRKSYGTTINAACGQLATTVTAVNRNNL